MTINVYNANTGATSRNPTNRSTTPSSSMTFARGIAIALLLFASATGVGLTASRLMTPTLQHAQRQGLFTPEQEAGFRHDLSIAYSLNAFVVEPKGIPAPYPNPPGVAEDMLWFEAMFVAYSLPGHPVVYARWTVCLDSEGGATDIYLKEEVAQKSRSRE